MPQVYLPKNKSLLWRKLNKVKRLNRTGRGLGVTFPIEWRRELDMKYGDLIIMSFHVDEREIIIRNIREGEIELVDGKHLARVGRERDGRFTERVGE